MQGALSMELQLSYFFVIPSAKRSYVGVVEGLPLSRSSWSLSAVYQHRSSAATPKIKKINKKSAQMIFQPIVSYGF
jgi:hypothetical protein